MGTVFEHGNGVNSRLIVPDEDDKRNKVFHSLELFSKEMLFSPCKLFRWIDTENGRKHFLERFSATFRE